MSYTQVQAKIEELQKIQQRHAPTTAAWQQASEELKPLFELMATYERVSSPAYVKAARAGRRRTNVGNTPNN